MGADSGFRRRSGDGAAGGSEPPAVGISLPRRIRFPRPANDNRRPFRRRVRAAVGLTLLALVIAGIVFYALS